jgi:glyoxalase family protein
MIRRSQLGVASEAAQEFWSRRLARRGYGSQRDEWSLFLEDCDGLGVELVVADDGNPQLWAVDPEVPTEHGILGVEGARAYTAPGTHADRELLTGSTCAPSSSAT